MHNYTVEYVQEGGMWKWVKKDSEGNVIKESTQSFGTEEQAKADFEAMKVQWEAQKQMKRDQM